MSRYQESHLSTLSNALRRMPKEFIEEVILARVQVVNLAKDIECVDETTEEEDER